MPILTLKWRVYYVDISVKPPEIKSFDSSQGPPADAQAFQNRYVLSVKQHDYYNENGDPTETETIEGASKYAHLVLQNKWTGTSQQELDEYAAEVPPIEVDAVLNGQGLPREIFQQAMALADTDDDFLGAAGPRAYDLEETARFKASVDRAVAIREGRPPPNTIEPVVPEVPES